MDERVTKFKSIFYGLDRAYGQYRSDGQSENGKAGGQAYILKKPVTDQLWIDHLDKKEPSLGIIPIRDNSKCIWGCIDIDTKYYLFPPAVFPVTLMLLDKGVHHLVLVSLFV